jgi:CheY-like chemotaxis protein
MAKILVIDDDPKIVQVLKIRLISAGYEVLTAGDGVSGLSLAIEGKPDLVILDIMMPVGGGFSVAHRLREQAPEIPVIFITASKEAGLRQMAEKMGAAGFLEKPYEPEAMLALVTEALMASAPSPVAAAQPPESPSTLHKLAPAAAHSPVSPPDTATITGGETILIVKENRKTELEPFNEHLESLAGEWTAALVAEIARNQRAHDALQQSERNFRNSLEGALDGTVVVDGQGLVVFANAAATNIFGRPQEQFLGAPFGWPITAGQIIERDVVNSAGQRMIVEVRTVPTVWQGAPACLVTLRDITERKGAEARMQRRQTALEESNRDLQRRNQGVQAIYHTLSHELKTRLTSVHEFVSMLDARLESVPPSLDSQPVALGETPASVNVLIVDDEAEIRDALRALLEKQGYQVTVAPNGVEALELMLHQPPALVVLDLDMPEMDGAETLGFIRKQWKAIPVVVHTAYPEGELMNRARKVCPFTVLAKPSPSDRILATVRALVRPIPGRLEPETGPPALNASRPLEP